MFAAPSNQILLYLVTKFLIVPSDQMFYCT